LLKTPFLGNEARQYDHRVLDDSPKPWTLTSSLLVGVAGLIGLVATLAAFLSRTWSVCDNRGLTPAELSSLNVIASCAVAASVGWACIAFVRRGAHVGFWESIEWRPFNRGIAAAGLIGICCCFLTRFILTQRIDLSLHVTAVNRLLLLVLLGTVILQPLMEEIYFRGILFCGLNSKLNPSLSAGVVTIAFVVLHPQHQLIVLTVALALGVVRVVSRSTCCCFALHLFYNLGVVLWGVR